MIKQSRTALLRHQLTQQVWLFVTVAN